jgi:hypothetical protein
VLQRGWSMRVLVPIMASVFAVAALSAEPPARQIAIVNALVSPEKLSGQRVIVSGFLARAGESDLWLFQTSRREKMP